MPFDLHSSVLGGDAFKVLVDFVEREFAPEARETFYRNSGHAQEEWLRMKRGSHGDYGRIVTAFYTGMGKMDPELLNAVYKDIGTTQGSPVRTLAKILGSAPAVVEASAAISALLNDDSRVKAYNVRSDGALIQQTILGPTELAYPEQVFGAMGYYRGLASLFGLESIDVQLRMLSMPLPLLLKKYAPHFFFEEDSKGNLYSEKGLFAVTESYAQSSRAFHGLPQPLWDLGDGTFFIGTPKQRKGRELDLEEILLLETIKGLEDEGVPFIHEGVLFGGKHPAPTNVYDLSWKAKNGFRQKVWLFFSDIRARIFESKETVVHMALLADQEAKKRERIEAENKGLLRDLENYRTSMAAETLAAYRASEETRVIVDAIEARVHDYKNRIATSLSLEADEGVIPILHLAEQELPREEILRLFADYGGSAAALERNYRRTMAGDNGGDLILCDPATLLKLYDQVLEFARKASSPPWKWVVNTFDPSLQERRRLAEQGFMDLVDILSLIREGKKGEEIIHLGSLIEGELEHWQLERRMGMLCADIQPLDVYGNERALQMTLFNLLDNAIGAARKGREKRVALSLVSEDRFAVLHGSNTGLPVSRDVADLLGKLRRANYSTRENGKGGVGSKFIAETVNAHGGSIFYEPRPEGGLEWELRLPLSS